jgi:integrase
MRRTGHIRERAPGSFELRYEIAPDPATGKRRTETVTMRGSRKEADKELRKLLRALDTGEYVEPNSLTVREYMQQWLDTAKGQVSPKSHERYEEIVAGFINPALGNHKLTKLMPIHIQNAYSEWEAGGRRDGKEGGLSPRSRLHIHRILKSALKSAVQLQMLARNPAEAVKPPKPVRIEMKTLTAAESAQLLAAVAQSRLYWPVLVALTTGMRRGEIVALRWKNTDLDKGVARVVESLEQTKKGIRFKAPKNNKSRVITLPALAVEELRRLKTEQAEELLKLGVAQSGETLVCGRFDGEPLQPDSLTFGFARHLKGMEGFPRIRFHDLRHSHATQLLLSGIHPKIAQERLGHSSVAVTLDIYSHVTENMQNDAAAKLDNVFRSAINAAAVDSTVR